MDLALHWISTPWSPELCCFWKFFSGNPSEVPGPLNPSSCFFLTSADYDLIICRLKLICCGFPASAGKEFTCNAGGLGSIPGLGGSPGEGKGYLLQYSGLENSMDSIDHGVAKSRTHLSNFHFQFHPSRMDWGFQGWWGWFSKKKKTKLHCDKVNGC